MSTYQGRPGPNVTEYINTLQYDPSQFGSDLLDFSNDLSLLTNTEFINTDFAQDDQSFDLDLPTDPNNNMYEFIANSPPQQNINNGQVQSPTESAQYYSSYNTPIQPAPVANFSQVPSAQNTTYQAQRKKVDTSSPNLTPEEKSRLAAEEDKRRRNTAASARFRVKKKQREQTLEKDLREMREKYAKLEEKANELEMRNKWMEDLFTKKYGIQFQEKFADSSFLKFRKDSEERDTKESPVHTTGVGTD